MIRSAIVDVTGAVDVRIETYGLATLTRLVAETRHRQASAEGEWRQEIKRLLDKGIPAPRVAEFAGVTRSRIYQIRDGR